MIFDVTIDQPWFIGSWIGVVERPEAVDEAVDRNDEYAGVGLLAQIRGYAFHAASDVGMFVRRRELPRWLRRRFAGPRSPTRR